MCGISGIAFAAPGRPVDPSVLMRMRDVMTHRGPDAAGLFVDGSVGIAHRRLSIVDLTCGGQPMGNEDGSLQIVYNGEVYNHADYRQGLEARGHVFATHSDTEAILHLYEDHGPACVDRLRGMFAFAIWDRRQRELFIARDRLGVKPLYYVHQPDGSLYFASEIKALLQAGAVRSELNHAALPDYLANHATSDEATLFAGVQRLLPGHWLRWKDGRVEIRRYWDVHASPLPAGARDERGAIDAWWDTFQTSVRLRLMADVPLGMFLSGGIDSSAIAAVMSRLVRDPIKTFSVGFADREANEFAYARMVADAFRTDHHEVHLSASDFFAALPHLVWHEDEPIGHPASVPLYFVSQLASRYVKVVLTGEGSDELLAGYNRYRATVFNLAAARWYERTSTQSIRQVVRSVTGALAPAALARRLPRTFLWLPPDVSALYFDNFAVFPRAMQRRLLSAGAQSRLAGQDAHAGMRAYFESRPGDTLLNRLLYTDIKTYLHELLMKQDQMSMAASVESRVPFLDHELVALSMALPDRLKLHGWTTKYVLRKAAAGLLPAPILSRKKMGFPVPLRQWFGGDYRPLLEDYLLGPRAAARGLFDIAFVRELLNEHAAGAANHSERLWSLLNLEIWQRQFIDGEPLQGNLPELPETAVPGRLAAA